MQWELDHMHTRPQAKVNRVLSLVPWRTNWVLDSFFHKRKTPFLLSIDSAKFADWFSSTPVIPSVTWRELRLALLRFLLIYNDGNEGKFRSKVHQKKLMAELTCRQYSSIKLLKKIWNYTQYDSWTLEPNFEPAGQRKGDNIERLAPAQSQCPSPNDPESNPSLTASQTTNTLQVNHKQTKVSTALHKSIIILLRTTFTSAWKSLFPSFNLFDF